MILSDDFNFQNDLAKDDELELFNSSLLNRLPNLPKENGLLVRPLRSTDYDKGNFIFY